MIEYSSSHTGVPVVKGVSYFLAHIPSMVRYGSKPSREIEKDGTLLSQILNRPQNFGQAVAYPPNQVFIGNLDPDELLEMPSPWHQNPVPNASPWGAFGEIMPKEEFYGMMKICDEFNIVLLEEGFVHELTSNLKDHPLFDSEDINKLGNGSPLKQIETAGYSTKVGGRAVGSPRDEAD